MIHIITPYRNDKDLGKAYNEAMALIPDDDYACLIDIDVCFLTPDAPAILYRYAESYPEAAVMTCYTNRISMASKEQLLMGKISDDYDYSHHILIAEQQRKYLYEVTEITGHISGMLMLISKKAWKEMPFDETGQCLGVDSAYSAAIHEAGKIIYRMDGLYVWHGYRIKNGIYDRRHLK